MDDLIRERIRDWQFRRLEIKERMQSHPEETLELAQVLDLMDEEHAAILSGAAGHEPEAGAAADEASRAGSPQPADGGFSLQLHVAAHSGEDLSRLLDLAVHELQKQIQANAVAPVQAPGVRPGSMSGTLGDYRFELHLNDGVADE
ncbi:hypothetical protein KVG96_15440 [Pseudomonas sp. COR58]|uniref:Uncharacterized protein n=1 Tax=Pseudomonas ekonensis TaxID=2842353 RepID=A0ABS6PH24_9PSED|nr:hypothetical protein [Pseudomonas ekonensis]MBV4459347.1 hypothetical protein [Pseudomonas ekonensis]